LYEERLGEYQRSRDREARPVYELTDKVARLQPPPPRGSWA
jgi:hypothetical protein